VVLAKTSREVNTSGSQRKCREQISRHSVWLVDVQCECNWYAVFYLWAWRRLSLARSAQQVLQYDRLEAFGLV
jgi:hypothetical protein